jgi:hypothetical protein
LHVVSDFRGHSRSRTTFTVYRMLLGAGNPPGSVAAMEWTDDVSAGDWIRDRIDGPGRGWAATMHGVVPRDFPAYARIFHRPYVGWVEGRPYPTQEELRETDPSTWPETFGAPTTWTEAAAVFGTELHGTAQWNRIVRRGGGDPGAREWDTVIGPDGREYSAPEEGRLDAAQLAAAAEHLAAFTTTPDEVCVGLWDGWGGVVGFFGETPSRATLTFTADDDADVAVRHTQMLERSIHDPFNNVFRKPVWQPGLLPDEVSRGARLELPQRTHVLFTGSIRELADPSWAETVPWAETNPEWTQSPSLVWPADRAWVLVTEVDFDSTIVGGSAELVRAICTDPRIEARAVREGAELGWDADEVNR